MTAEAAMRRLAIGAAGLLTVGLGGCVSYHQEVPALRMVRPSSDTAGLAAYTAPDPAYPSVGGNILRGTSPKSVAAYDATSGAQVPAAPDPASH